MSVIYLIARILTYPAAYLKGFWEHTVCRALKIPVTRGGYLRSCRWCGHVEHEKAETPWKAFLVVFLPWLFQKLLALLFLTASAIPLLLFGLRGSSETSFFWIESIFLYLGVSFLCNAYPILDDAQHLWRFFYSAVPPSEEGSEKAKRPSPIARVLLAPLNVSFVLCAWLESYGAQVVIWFGAAVALYLVG